MLDRPNVIEASIREFLRLSARDREAVDVMRILDLVGLAETVGQLPQGLDTPLVVTGWPLSITQTLQVKLAANMIAKPRVLVLSQAYDAVPEADLLRAMDYLQKHSETTIVYFTYQNIDLAFTHYLRLGHEQQTIENSYQSLCESTGLAERPARAAVDLW